MAGSNNIAFCCWALSQFEKSCQPELVEGNYEAGFDKPVCRQAGST